MKKILFLLLLLSLSAVTVFAQKAETKPSKSAGDFQVGMNKFLINIEIENKTILENITIKPNDDYSSMYLSGNWGTVDKKVVFTKDIKKQTVPFAFVVRVIQVGEAYKIFKENENQEDLQPLLEANLFSDVKSKKILCQVEFVGSNNELIKKDLEINFDQNSKVDGDQVFAKASITNEDLGLNVVSLKVDTEKLFFKFSLKNDEYGVSMVVDPNSKDKTTKISTLAGKAMPDGIYPFTCRIGLPNGIQKETSVEAFVVDNEISLDNSSFNPLAFTYGDTSNAVFEGKISLVKFVNTRSTALTIFLPADYVVSGKSFTSQSSDIQTEAFTQNGGEWKSYVIAPGGYVKVKMKVSIFPIVLYDLNRKNTNIVQIGLVSKNFQVINLKWGDRFSLSNR